MSIDIYNGKDPENIQNRLQNLETVEGAASEMYEEAERHYHRYIELVTPDNLEDGTMNFMSQEQVLEAQTELEYAARLLEKAETDLQERSGHKYAKVRRETLE